MRICQLDRLRSYFSQSVSQSVSLSPHSRQSCFPRLLRLVCPLPALPAFPPTWAHHFLTTCPLPFGVAATAVETATRDSSVLLSVNARGPRLSCQVISIQRFFLSFSSWHTHQYLDEGQTVLIIHKAMYHNKLYYPSGVRKERQGQRCQ